MLYTLADKFLDRTELDEIKEVMRMTRLGQMLMDSVTAKCKIKDEAREHIAEYILQKEQLPNHQRCIFGVVDKAYNYIGAPGTREDGIKRNKELRKIYPQHPCFQDVKNGITRGQEILLRK